MLLKFRLSFSENGRPYLTTGWLPILDGMFDENNKTQRDVLYFVPPKPIREFVYLCDKKFRIDLIEDLYQQYDDYGVLYLSGCEFSFYILNGKDLYEITKTTRKRLPRTHKRGGQSQNRIARLRDEAIHNYLVKLNEKCLELFIDEKTTLPKIKGLVIIGSGNKKIKFQDKLDPRIKAILLGVITSDHLDYKTAFDTVQRSIKEQDNKIIQDILDDENTLEYGEKETIKSLDDGYLKCIIITPKMKTKLIKNNIDINQKCEDMSCQLYIQYHDTVELMGGIIGQKWY
jgi:peptide chain release factor subunit 1